MLLYLLLEKSNLIMYSNSCPNTGNGFSKQKKNVGWDLVLFIIDFEMWPMWMWIEKCMRACSRLRHLNSLKDVLFNMEWVSQLF